MHQRLTSISNMWSVFKNSPPPLQHHLKVLLLFKRQASKYTATDEITQGGVMSFTH